MDTSTQHDITHMITEAIDKALASIDQEREREIIARRFGLFERKETLEQIGEMLGITRERVRQLEKAILIRLKIATEEGKLPETTNVERAIVRDLTENGRIGRVQDITKRLVGDEKAPKHKSHIAFLAELSPKLTVVNENDNYHHGVSIQENDKESDIKKQVDHVVKTLKNHGEPLHVEQLHEKLGYDHPNHASGMASISKKLASLKDHWGLAKWPAVNPKNIRDKIYVILADKHKPMHFSEIAEAIKDSSFKRKDVTTQAIHNELIKDKRFVLIGRGIYALDTWGYSKGTVSDIIRDVLREASEPLHRDDIVRRVLKKRQVKETTIMLNLQSKPEFKRVAKATYALAEEPAKKVPAQK